MADATREAGRFENLGLGEETLAAVADMGFARPTPVQGQAIPLVLEGRDVMAGAQTGTGKTAAFVLPILDRLPHAPKGCGPLALVVTPTRELAQQIKKAAQAVCEHTRHRAVVVVGGVGYEPQKDALAKGCDLLVATPGRLLDLVGQGCCNLGEVETLVLDEADRMLDMGFLPDVRRIVGMLPERRQTLLFSATLDDAVMGAVGSLLWDPARVQVAPKGTVANTVDQYVLGVTPQAKKRVLVEVLRREGSDRVLVFVRGKHRADHLCRVLGHKGFAAASLHGGRTQGQRTRALERFAAGEVDVLVATDVLSRGIDVSEVSYVVNLDVPHDAEDYVHRIGRTGRAGRSGWALTLCSEPEYLDLRDIERLIKRVIDPYPGAKGIDCGQPPFVPDPNRRWADGLPGKKARKRMRRG